MKIIIRNDDVSYFTKPSDLEKWYKDIWHKYPIHLAVIPRISRNCDVAPLSKKVGNTYMEINKNKRLVTFLKKKQKENKVVIWQHGLTHSNKGNKFECERAPYRFWQGKQVLEDTFGKIKVFVAPHDQFSRKAIKYIEELNMNICRGFAPRPREFRWNSWDAFLNLYTLYWLLYRKTLRFPHWQKIGNHKELYSYRLGEIKEKDIDDILEFHKDGVLCITVHHRHMSQESLEKLKYIIARIER